MVKNSFIEKTYVVGTHWNCLIEAIPMYTYNIATENKEENYLEIYIFQVSCPFRRMAENGFAPPPPPPPREFCRHILSCSELKAESFKTCLHSVRWGVSL